MSIATSWLLVLASASTAEAAGVCACPSFGGNDQEMRTRNLDGNTLSMIPAKTPTFVLDVSKMCTLSESYVDFGLSKVQ
jgi:hypothetical protein